MSVPRLVDLRGHLPDPGALDPVVKHLGDGGLIAYPTETVYGIGGLARPGPVEALRRLKGRGEDHPFLLLLPSVGEASALRWTDPARALAEVFWPGALTLVLGDPGSAFPAGVRSAAGTVAVRVSPHPLVRLLLEEVGEPITSTSANPPGAEPARTGEAALDALRDMGAGEEAWILDHGTLPPSAPSTVVDCTGPVPTVLREGSIPVARLGCVLERLEVKERV